MLHQLVRSAYFLCFIPFFLFIFACCIPLAILITANTITLLALKRMHEKIENGIHTVLNRKRIEMERRILKSKNLKRVSIVFFLLTQFSYRYCNYNLWFYFYMDSLCSDIFCLSISRQRLCHTTIGHFLLYLYC